MENAAKALYIAAGVLIGIMLLSVLAYLFGRGAESASTMENNESTKQIEQYNSKLVIYNTDDNTIYDVVTACNLAYTINKQNEGDNINYLDIYIYGITGASYRIEHGNWDSVKQGCLDDTTKLSSLIKDHR